MRFHFGRREGVIRPAAFFELRALSMSGHPVLFLSHASVDAQTAHELKRRLLASPDARAACLEVFLDRDDLKPGRMERRNSK
jgi:hypothetical protein